MWLWWDSLPVSAVPDGFIFSGINIAYANEYFGFGKINNNVNTATEDQLRAIFINYGDVGDEMAKVIIDGRKRPDNNGFENIEDVVKLLKSKVGGMLESGFHDEDVKSRLSVAYKPSEETDLL